MADHRDVTRLLGSAAEGEAGAAAELLEVVYDELRRIAAALLRDQRPGHTLQPTALVHEAYLKLVGGADVQWSSRQQFFFVAARAMRHILVDHARGKGRAKRGGAWRRVGLEAAEETPQIDDATPIVDIDEALQRLAALDERQARLVELRFFAGLTSEQAAELLGMSRTTAAEQWRLARAWLLAQLEEELR